MAVNKKEIYKNQEKDQVMSKSAFFGDKKEKLKQKPTIDVPTSISDVATSQTKKSHKVNVSRLREIVKNVIHVSVSGTGMPVRMSEDEKHYLNEYIHKLKQDRDIQEREVSVSKILRASALFMISEHEKELSSCFKKEAKKEKEFKL